MVVIRQAKLIMPMPAARALQAQALALAPPHPLFLHLLLRGRRQHPPLPPH
jgi:hypothetical protein